MVPKEPFSSNIALSKSIYIPNSIEDIMHVVRIRKIKHASQKGLFYCLHKVFFFKRFCPIRELKIESADKEFVRVPKNKCAGQRASSPFAGYMYREKSRIH